MAVLKEKWKYPQSLGNEKSENFCDNQNLQNSKEAAIYNNNYMCKKHDHWWFQKSTKRDVYM